ncbi:MAG: hypothetical protein ABW133_03240, partial [Polyangiaceae bacterium]
MSGTERSFGVEAHPIAADRFSRLGALISFVAPFSVVVAHAGTASIWRDDLTLLRGLAWIGGGRSGCVSALLAQVSFFLPIGSLHFRLALVAAIVLGAAGGAIHALVRDLLRRGEMQVPLLASAVATIAALAATLSAAAQREGGTLGGGGVALLLALLALWMRPGEALAEPRRAIALGSLVGALAAESPGTAFAVIAALATARFFEEPPSRTQGAPWALGAAIVTAVLLMSPAWVRPFAKDSFFEGARVLTALAAPPLTGLGGGISERIAVEGAVAVSVAVLGLLYGLRARVLRSGAVAFAIVLLCDLLATIGEAKWWPRADVAPLHFLASAVIAAGTAIAVYALATTLLAWRLAMAKGAAILLVMTDLTLAVAAAEEASFSSDLHAWRGAEALTDELWDDLPPNAV